MKLWPSSFRSLRVRLIIWNAVTLALIFGVLGWLHLSSLRGNLIATVDRELLMRTDRIAKEGPPSAPPPVPNWRQDNPFRPRRIDADGTVRGEVPSPWDGQALRQALAEKHPNLKSMQVSIGGRLESVRLLSRPYPANEFGPAGIIQAPYSLKEIDAAVARQQRMVLLLLPLALIGAALGGRWLIDRLLRSVRRIARSAEQIGAEDLSRRLDQSGGDELAQLAGTFNRMLERLDAAFIEQQRLLENQKRFTGDASHELKTPLAVIKANTTLTLTGQPDREEALLALKEVDAAADSMTKLVQDLLLLARSDARQLGRDRIQASLREILDRALARLSRRHGAPVTISAEADRSFVEVNEDEAIRLFANLLENARRHTPQEGGIWLDVDVEGDFVVVTVRDTGSGIPPEHVAHLGERFYRVDAGRSRSEGGTGLGLSICRSIVEAHGGRLTISSRLGEGTSVSVSLPSAPISIAESSEVEPVLVTA